MSNIKLEDVWLTYADAGKTYTALQDVSFEVESGSFVSIIGSSGCGKSTLLSLLEGLNFPTEGSATIDGEEITGPGQDRSVVFQNYSLFPWMSVKDNVVYGLRQIYKKKTKKELEHIATDFLEQVDLAKALDKYPSQLSGGMQQRVAIARALSVDPQILLMDEPFGAIDAKNKVILQELLLSLWESGAGKRKTVVFVTHDIDEAILLSDRIIMLSSSPGTVLQDLTVPFSRPRSRKELLSSKEYHRFRNTLLSLFFGDVAEKIDQQAVL